jgi:lipopolysaccharide export system protein LptA
MKRLPLLASLAAALLLAGPLSAQTVTAPAVTAPVPTVITAGYAEVWSDAAGLETFALFKDNVVVTGTNLRITCDRIDATLAGKNETPSPAATAGTAQNVERFKTVIATGKVRIIQGDREANCERAEVFPREGKIVLTGQPVVQDHGGGFTWIGEPMTLLKNERRVLGPNTKLVLPVIKDLGFDKNAPLPKPAESGAAPAAK